MQVLQEKLCDDLSLLKPAETNASFEASVPYLIEIGCSWLWLEFEYFWRVRKLLRTLPLRDRINSDFLYPEFPR